MKLYGSKCPAQGFLNRGYRPQFYILPEQKMTGLKLFARRAKDILQSEGLTAFVRRGWDFVGQRFFSVKFFYLYEHQLKDRNEADFLPQIQNIALHIVRTNEEANRLAEITGFDFRSRLINGQERLDKGGIAFCILADGEFAHIGWVALNEKAKRALDDRPYKIDFSNKQACTGGTYTVPEYRGKGLMTYGYFKRFQFLREQGFKTSRNVVSTDNISSRKSHAKFGPRVVAKARHVKFFCWEFWKETPFPG
ncbi:MAG: hypothetical protein FJ004_06025 [Chloroflexi bacterium]|nr:hypothetical protein [Chloroflexota bacterium]